MIQLYLQVLINIYIAQDYFKKEKEWMVGLTKFSRFIPLNIQDSDKTWCQLESHTYVPDSPIHQSPNSNAIIQHTAAHIRL